MSVLRMAVAFALSGSLTAQAFVSYVNESGRVLRWNLAAPGNNVHPNVVNRTTGAIRYFLASDAYSSTNRTAELNAIRACFGQWQSVPGTILKFEEGGLVGSGIDLKSDNTNVVFWAKNSTLVNGGLDDIRGLQGLTIVRFAADNTILEADIVLNGVQQRWFTEFDYGNRSDSFVEAVVLHEIGHLIGLDHSPVGGATVTTSFAGISTEVGLSSDDISAARALYPQPSTLAGLGHLRGRVLMNGAGVFGAMVTAEDTAGNVAAGTVSRANGSYDLSALAPGDYKVRVTPLDPANADDSSSLMRGRDIAFDYENAVTSFLPTTNRPVKLSAGVTNSLDFTVVSGNPAFRIAAISHPTFDPALDTMYRWASTVRLGDSGVFIGVVSPTLPTAAAAFLVTGDGITVGPPFFKPNRFFGNRNFIGAMINIAPDATPGLRSLTVQQGSNVAYANGYLEVLPPFPDHNFDGFDDTFQRRYFPVFTALEAGPDADPDGDGFSNRFEFATGSDPTNPLSFNFKIQGVTLAGNGSTITWQSAVGKRYQVFSRPDFPNRPWQPVGPPVAARGSMTQYLDTAATNQIRFYRVQALP